MAKKADVPKDKKKTKAKAKDSSKKRGILLAEAPLFEEVVINREPVLYQIVRTDLASMPVGGKAVAQAGHAATAAVLFALEKVGPTSELLREWAGDRGYGTAISMGADEATLRAKVAAAMKAGEHAGLIVDPTYPLVDGAVTHLIELLTAGFVFGRRYVVEPLVSDLERLP